MSTVIAQYHDEAEWLRVRKTGIGGSDVAALFGAHPWKSKYQLWLEKTGKVTDDVRENADIRRGRLLEPVAVQIYVERTGNTVRRQPLRRHREHNILLASIDRQVFATDERPTRALEVKCPRSHVFGRTRREGLPPYAILQGQHEAGVWGYQETEYAVFGADDAELITFPIPFDAGVWNRIIEESERFWGRHVQADEPPPEDEVPPPIDLPIVSGTLIRRDDDDFHAAAHEWQEAKDIADEATTLRDVAKERITSLIAGVAGCYEGGGYRFYYSQREGRRSFDEKALRAAGVLDSIAVWQWMTANGHATPTPDEMKRLEAEWALDLDQFVKRGSPYFELRGYRLRRGEEL